MEDDKSMSVILKEVLSKYNNEFEEVETAFDMLLESFKILKDSLFKEISNAAMQKDSEKINIITQFVKKN